MTLKIPSFEYVLGILYRALLIVVPNGNKPDPDKGFNIHEVVSKNGYNLVQHEVTTEDGYILQAFRLSNNSKSIKGPPVLLQHGIITSSFVWLQAGVDNGLGYNLADEGYDVWLSNSRGNFWGRNHTTLNPDDQPFWNFSFNEMGYYDLPATIDYITNITGEDKIIYIGHSQGATSFLIMAATRPEMNKKIAQSVLLSPVVYGKDIKAKFLNKNLTEYEFPLKIFSEILGVRQVFPYSKLLDDVFNLLCKNGSPFQNICIDGIFSLSGYNRDELDTNVLPLSLHGSGSSLQQLIHYLQIFRTGHFRKFDYGFLNNLWKYGNFIPPTYNIINVTTPVALFYSENDYVSRVYDVKRLSKNLQNITLMYKIAEDKFNHMDYFCNVNVKKHANEPILELLSALK